MTPDCALPVIVDLRPVGVFPAELDRTHILITTREGSFIATLTCHDGDGALWRKRKIKDRLTTAEKD